MSRLLAIAVTITATLAYVAGTTSSASASDDDISTRGVKDDGSYLVEIYGEAIFEGVNIPGEGEDDGINREFTQAPLCNSGQYRHDLSAWCELGDPVVIYCLDGTEALEPLWMRVEQSDGSWGSWSAISWYYCPQDADLERRIFEEWTSLTPTQPDIAMQPPDGWVYASMPTIVHVDDEPVVEQFTINGVDVRIRATHNSYTWNWGDGNETITSDPGAPYPNETVFHTYTHYEGDVQVTLTTSWSGEYSINGGDWIDIDGNIFTTSTPIPLTVHNPHSHLVDCDLDGNCGSGNAPTT